MSDQENEIATKEKSPKAKRSGSLKVGIFFSTLAIVIFFFGFGYGYFQLAKINISLAQMVSDLQNQSIENKNEISSLQKSIVELQQAEQKTQALSAKQEQIIADWQAAQKGNFNLWHVAEAGYLVRLADDHVQLTHNITVAIALLQRADQVLQNLEDSDLSEIRKSLATNLAKLQMAPQVDITGLYLQLTALNNQLDQLPLPINPLKANASEEIINQPGLPWWKTGLNETWNALRKVVIVRYHVSPSLPLVMPEEKVFLYQNLHAQMENAMWAALHRNAPVYQASLARAMMWIKQYFDQDAALTKTTLQHLDVMQKVTIQSPTVNLSDTLKLFDNYLAQAKTAQ